MLKNSFVVLCFSALALACGCKPSLSKSRDGLQQAAVEILSIQPYFRMLVPDWSGKHLAYVHATGPGRRLYICDLRSLEIQLIPGTNDITEVFGWSDDDRFLAFAQSPPIPPNASETLPISWITIYDAATGATQRIGTNWDVVERSATWLPNGQLFFTRHVPGTASIGKFILDVNSHTTKAVSNYVNNFILMKSNMCAFFSGGNLQACLLDTTDYPPMIDLTDFGTNTFDQMRWLHFRAETSTFLFCARKTNSNWRCLYEYDLATRQLSQLTTRGTYNGQYLGGGFAYVANTNNEMYLALNPVDSQLVTNLFKGGNVVTYATSKDGNHVYAVASENTEPPALWEYTVSSKRLRQLASGQPEPLKKALLVSPQMCWAKSFDALTVPYFVLPPVELSENPISTNKFPVVLYLPPATWQFQHAFDLTAQFYANLNCWYLAVNYRGGDGYGRDFNNLNDTVDAAHDALVVLAKLGENSNVDLQRVILSSESSGAEEALELLARYPQKWRGAILRHPNYGPETVTSLPDHVPPLFIVCGSLERTVPNLHQFADLANRRGLSVELRVQKGSGHEVFSTDQTRETMLKELKFFQIVKQ